ncbi:unnamed protein product [Cylicocyclus nassatus]|uniref:Uncharacterized protein n=1 Tax=Cylicocyclus nassatus TaxID=53992 RepID=A0AA36HHC5_CYLNA|nr:unnamed protein product [Cylicocyclus nassatus]CAJ0610727.1 unnamed protein product [Cylicocyclus nassatus]
MDYGYRAALYLIRKYINKGYATVGDIISRWAPTNENNTQAYINSVCNQTGFTPFTRISFDRKADVIKLAAAMSVHENGNIPGYPDQAAIENGYNMLQTNQQSSYRTIGMLTIAVVAIFAADNVNTEAFFESGYFPEFRDARDYSGKLQMLSYFDDVVDNARYYNAWSADDDHYTFGFKNGNVINLRRLDMITLLTLGAIALGLIGARKQPVAGIGATKKAKRRIYQQMAELQQFAIPLGLKWADLSAEEQGRVKYCATANGFTGSSRSTKSVPEQYYNSISRAYNAISGIGETDLPHTDYTIRNDRGDVILTYHDYGTDAQILQRALDWFYESFVDVPNVNGYYATAWYIATGRKLNWQSVKQECFATTTNANAERKARISYLAKDGATVLALAHDLWQHSGGERTDMELRDEIISALLSIQSVGQAQQYVLDAYYDAHQKQDAYNDVPF